MSILLPRYEFTRSANLSEEEEEEICNWLANLDFPNRPQNPLPLTLETSTKFDVVTECHLEWAKHRFGYDLKLRTPISRSVHELENLKNFSLDVKGYSGSHIMPFNEIYLLESDEIIWTFGHELMHALAGCRYHVERVNGHANVKYNAGLGYEIGRRFKNFNESVTESANLEAFAQYKQERADPIVFKDIAYYKDIIFFDGIMEEAANRLDMSTRKLRDRVYRGYFESNHGKLKFLHEAYGSKGLRFLMIFDSYLIKESIIKSWLSLEKTDIFDKIKAYEEGKPIEILGGIEVQNSEVLR